MCGGQERMRYEVQPGVSALGGNETTPNGDNNVVVGQPQSGVWFHKTDDLWTWGCPQGWGGPWRRTPVEAGAASDPFLFTDFERKALNLVATDSVNSTIEIDFLGNGTWVRYDRVNLTGGEYKLVTFPEGFSAHWVRLVPSGATHVTAEFVSIRLPDLQASELKEWSSLC